MFQNMNMGVERNFEIMSDSFNVGRICINGYYARKHLIYTITNL